MYCNYTSVLMSVNTICLDIDEYYCTQKVSDNTFSLDIEEYSFLKIVNS
jgi:hypothetical protein